MQYALKHSTQNLCYDVFCLAVLCCIFALHACNRLLRVMDKATTPLVCMLQYPVAACCALEVLALICFAYSGKVSC